jgi:hypothetical protein
MDQVQKSEQHLAFFSKEPTVDVCNPPAFCRAAAHPSATQNTKVVV